MVGWEGGDCQTKPSWIYFQSETEREREREKERDGGCQRSSNNEMDHYNLKVTMQWE